MIEGGSPALSPNGEHLVYTGRNQANTQLFRRSFPDGEVREIPETLGARTPFFSPDSQTLGCFVDNELFQATLRGFGTRVAPVFGRRLGAAWAADGSIFFGPPDSLSIKGPLEVLSPGKEVAAPLTKLQTTASQFYELHCFPQVSPGGRGILYASQRKDGGSAMLYRFDTGEQLKLAEDVLGVRFLPPRFLVFCTTAEPVAGS